ncbi:MAG: ABC transporter permease [Gracilibacter sp. BRH_c7a]|nr:MAG: ABC transporter permease [Gracilibacter sp. BRH_c7a]
MNRAFFGAMFRQQRPKLLKFSTGIVLYEGLLTWVYPLISKNSAVTDIVDSIPSTVKTVFGVSPKARADTFEAFISAQFLARIWSVIIALYGINTANTLLSKPIDEGSLVFPLSTPVSRTNILTTQTAVLLSCNATLIAATVLGLCVGTFWFRIRIRYSRYISLGTLALAFFSLISSYSFLFAAWAKDGEKASAYAYGLTFGFYALDVIGGLSKRSAWVGKFSIFRFFKPQEVLEGTFDPSRAIIGLTAGSILLTVITIRIFNESDLPL